MEKLDSVYEPLQEIADQKETELEENEIKRECQFLWKTLCEADPEENMFTSNAYKNFMVGCVAKLAYVKSKKRGRSGL